ncbi:MULTISPECIES: DUF6011 domain-containing protein [Clostridium]|uniref:DUF6011 domain-containing protein n=1 Tax=Clostridium lapidicellarium TaxID=3240931 RepID=A0ABV4DWJ6_9CLOT
MDRCLVCGRKLKSKESKEIGIGPVCLSRINKVKREQKKRHKEKIQHKQEILKGQINMFND